MDTPRTAVVALVIMTFQISLTFGASQTQFILNAEQDKAMKNDVILDVFPMATMSIDRCLQHCLGNCLCRSFQICNIIHCQLCSADKYSNSSAYEDKTGCINFDFERRQTEENNQQCSGSCSMSVNCCLKSNPCLNGGTCLPPDPTQTRARFKCKCPDGYTGNRCEKPIRSCRGYNEGLRVPGKYKVFGNNMTLHEVFCDFNTTSGLAWTLIQSYDYQRHNAQKVKPLVDNDPSNEDNPSWNNYRLSKSRMESIQNDSEKWRMTCQYERSISLGSSELVMGQNEEMNILTDKAGCFLVDYINVRGHSCRNCTVYFYQKFFLTLHFWFDENRNNKCVFRPAMGRADGDYFGAYYYKDPAHKCSDSMTATTQTWFGGY